MKSGNVKTIKIKYLRDIKKIERFNVGGSVWLMK